MKKPYRHKLISSTDEIIYTVIKYNRYPYTLLSFRFTNDLTLVQVLIDILSIVSLCHSLGIWHRDIKLENILFKDGRATLIDFTHSKYKHMSVLDYNVQTETYRAPEVFNKSLYNEKIDIWSIGVCLYNLICKTELYEEILNISCDQDTVAYCKFFASDYMPIVEKFYNTDNSVLFYKVVYITWIKQMLCHDISSRPCAESMLKTVLTFAADHQMAIVSPEWLVSIKPNVKSEYKSTSMLVLAPTWELRAYMHIVNNAIGCCKTVPKHVEDVIISLINYHYIDVSNSKLVIIAVSLIINTLYYDALVSIDEICHVLNDGYTETDAKKINIHIATLLNTRNDLLFY
jgi:serine/threonine protein kinase